jgi:amino acid permease
VTATCGGCELTIFQMFSILNELGDDSPGSIVSVVGASTGSAAAIYVLVAITGYLTFGNDVSGNIVSMCKSQRVFPVRVPQRRIANMAL